ncbi:MAG: B3/4 domain-containing protein [Bacillaceae bacterium]
MSKFIIEDSFWNLFPNAEIGVIVARGIDNTEVGTENVRPDIIELLEQSNHDAKKFLTEKVLSDNNVISVWREAYRKFKTKKGVRCSIEALLKRVDKGKEVGCINSLVDIYNSVSLQYGLPCGGEDIDTFVGNLRLTMTEGNDSFLALGDEEYDNTLPGEICYLDDEGAVCRCWNWRDGQRTMLTENTKNAFLIIESVDPSRSEDLKAALDMLAEWIQKCLGGTVRLEILTKDNSEMDLG